MHGPRHRGHNPREKKLRSEGKQSNDHLLDPASISRGFVPVRGGRNRRQEKQSLDVNALDTRGTRQGLGKCGPPELSQSGGEDQLAAGRSGGLNT